MDEILFPGVPAQDAPVVSSLTGALAGMGQRLEELRHRWTDFLFRWDEFKQGRRVRPGQFLAAALLLGAVTTAVTVYTPGYAVKVDGQELGVVADTAQFQAIETRVEDQISQILGREYTMSGHVSFERRVVEKRKLSSLAGFETYLFNQVSDVTRGYVLSLDGQTLTIQSNGEEVASLLEELKAPYVNENTILTEFTTPVELRYEYVGVNQLDRSLDKVRALLTSNTVEAVTYTVQSGDTTSAIAMGHDMSLDDLLAMNPEVDPDRLSIGQELTVRQSVPFLGVRTVDRETYQEAVPAPIEYVEDSTMYQGDTKTLDPGAEGVNLVTARVTYINGREQERDVTSTQVISLPQTKVVAKGTKERPKTMPKGYFIWPVQGPITSRYGGRSLFGTYNFHGGIDIYVPTGTSVKAADGGLVTTAQYHGSWGKYIVITHSNGLSTLYAHNSQLLVSAGERVYQGQVIAKSGATGNVTGPHCHFEVRLNGQRQNPQKYLP